MDLNLYRVFVQVYESATLAIASEKLHISQSAVSHALARLRQYFDDELFVKEGRRLVATAFARRLYPQVKQAVSVLVTATEHTNVEALIGQAKQITIAMNNEIELVLLPSLLAQFAKLAPHLQLNSVRLERSKMSKQLRLGLVDVAIDVTRVVSDNLHQKPLLTDEFVILSNQKSLSNQNSLNQQQVISLDSYINAHHIVVSSRPTGKSVEDVRLAQLGHYRHIAVRCQHYDSAVRLLRHSSKPYLLTLPKLLANSLNTMELIEHTFPVGLSTLSLHLYWHQEMDTDSLNCWIREQVYSATSSYSAI